MPALVEEISSNYLPREETARRLGCTPRTLAKYERIPDGIPHLKWAGRTLYPWSEVCEWFSRRVVRPNPRRRG